MGVARHCSLQGPPGTTRLEHRHAQDRTERRWFQAICYQADLVRWYWHWRTVRVTRRDPWRKPLDVRGRMICAYACQRRSLECTSKFSGEGLDPSRL